MYLLQGSVSVEGSIAYTSQQAWIFYGTVQDNILMGNPLDTSRYNRVLSSCSLQADLDILPHGDQTLLGDQGLNLSAGQRQKVSLARAIYSNKDLYLLDDPLSAVDTHTGKHIFEKCIKKELHGKTVILVTNQVQYMEFCDEVLVMNDGTIMEAGSHLDLMRVEGVYAELVTKHLTEQSVPRIKEKKKVDGQMNEGTSPVFNMSDKNTDAPSSDCKPADQLTDEEDSRKNSVIRRTFTTFGQYCNAGGGFCVSLFLLLVFIVLITNTVLSYSWLSYWLQQGHGTANVTSSERGNVSLNTDLPFYQLMFGVSIVVLMMVCIIKCFCYIKVTLHASTTLHNSLLNKIIACPMSFFESTPTGQILKCFSRYQEEIDTVVPHHLNVLLTFFLIVVSICVINTIIFPIMLLPIFILVTVFTLLMRTFLRNISELKQTESISRSQCVSLWTSIAQGLSTVHAYDKTHHYTQLFKTLCDINANHFMLFNSAMRWLCFLADSLSAAMTLPVALLVIFTSNDVCSPPMKALALSYIIQLRTNSQYLIQSLMEVETRFISMERLLEYITGCESEGSGKLQVDRVLEDWPQLGAITFLDYRMRYREDSPDVLNGLQLHIRAGEKLGIVGRAGSGKSSLAAALFRLVEPTAGSILIDGVDIKTISLSDLRTKLCIIPQDPVLFTGTVRYNLDPLNRCSDEEIWAALEKTYMKDIICSLDRRLNTELTEGGRGTFSVGQKQLMCLSRVLLQDCKIVILDEVTASVDAEMDAQIQITIREAFKSCTVLTIAHRLHTVLQADRVLVLDHGQVVEFDHPDVLKQKPDSLFSFLLTAATL
ncbi:multidrug resistance-associated protein 9 isoform X1 [Larimichthys crocea]|uniref:multidrug resistance-associated protein 9 isoform X1 n=2 Tax=Larimichthys crocea TaxID=215358 RepID=UPI000F601E46|nr:multidrug resistance-associated protein 9 isoform X1 [Larimichthys crocea]